MGISFVLFIAQQVDSQRQGPGMQRKHLTMKFSQLIVKYKLTCEFAHCSALACTAFYYRRCTALWKWPSNRVLSMFTFYPYETQLQAEVKQLKDIDGIPFQYSLFIVVKIPRRTSPLYFGLLGIHLAAREPCITPLVCSLPKAQLLSNPHWHYMFQQ